MVTVRSDPPTAIGPLKELQTAYKQSPTEPQTLCTQPPLYFVLKSHMVSCSKAKGEGGSIAE